VSIFGALFLSHAEALLIGVAVFIPFEQLAALHPMQRRFRKGWATDVLTGFMNLVPLYVALIIVLARLDALAAICVPVLRTWVETRPLWAQVVLALALGDLGIYGMHRLEHRVPWLWRFHSVHHSAEEMDWLVGFRSHPVDAFLLRVAALGPLMMLDVTPAAIGIYIAISGWQSLLVHANVRLPFGPLRWVFVSPEFHHWHHAAEKEAHDTNYASSVALWDVLFGTVHLPRGRQPLRYGLDEHVPAGWVNRFFHPFRKHLPAGSAEITAPVIHAAENPRSSDGLYVRSPDNVLPTTLQARISEVTPNAVPPIINVITTMSQAGR
jgi:sterol desaturase/sphingolipid hydroxylase (fatty acid hydroxylase superfamily)